MTKIFHLGILIVATALSLPVKADDVVPASWLFDYHQPQYDVMFSRHSSEATGPDARRMWHKIVYKFPQHSDGGDYSSEIVLVEIDCVQRTVALVRDLKYTANDTLLSDTVVPQKNLVRIKYYGKSQAGGLGSAIQGIGLTDDDDVCRTAD